MAAHRNAVGQPGDLHPEGFQQPGEVHGRSLALGVRVSGHNDLLYAALGYPFHQFFDAQVVRPHPIHRGDHAVENVVQAIILAGALHGDDILGLRHHADGVLLPLIAGANGTGAVTLGQILTDRTGMHPILGIQNGLGKLGGLIPRQAQHIEGQPLGALGSNTGQTGELLHQFFHGGG